MRLEPSEQPPAVTNHQEEPDTLEALSRALAEERLARQQAEAVLYTTKAALESTEESLLQAKEQFQAVLDAVPGGVSWINADLEYLGINSRLAATYGLTPHDFVGRKIGFLNNSPTFTEFVHDFINSREISAAREMDMEIDEDRRVYLIMAQKYRLGKSAVFVGIDITDRKLAEEKLFRDAFYDKLTGLPNRALLLERLERCLEYARRRESYLFAVLFLDFDGFKVVNDSLGHTNGDRLLAAIARRLETTVRTVDTVARLGGDEFVILLDDIEGLQDATHIAERIRRALSVPFNIEGQELFVGASIGITLSSPTYQSTEELLRDADTAMYRAKMQGRNRYEVFDREMHAQVMQRLQMETDLHRSMEQQDFMLYYQPIIDLTDGSICGFEALVRWQRPQRGFTVPGDFIALAEETGLIVRLDRWVLREACQQMQEWRLACPDRPTLSISVNLSSRQFSQPDLVNYIAAMLEVTGLPPHLLRLEITESTIMENIDSVAITLQKLRDLGIVLSIDDFGTGYSSLSYLHRLPLNTLKVDRSFVSGVDESSENLEIVRAIVSLAHGLKMNVVAEGIETPRQLQLFRGLGCEFAQGHLFARALSRDDAFSLLTDGQTWESLSPSNSEATD